MKRHVISVRDNWTERAQEVGFTYHTAGRKSESGSGTYWDESVAYEFTEAEVDELEDATQELHARCLDAVDKVVHDPELMTRMGIPVQFHDYILRSWQRSDPSLYGRFDLAYDGASAPTMLEYNADTPTMIIETALMQWFWLQDVKPGQDQFNSLHEKLLERLQQIGTLMPKSQPLYFTGYEGNEEEHQTCLYLCDLAQQAGLQSEFMDLSKIGWTGSEFVTEQMEPMKFWFKLYPWEWMFQDEFGAHTCLDSAGILEPVWKSVLSNKGILPILYEMFPDHPNILPAYWTADPFHSQSYVAKPMLSREGANIQMVENGQVVAETPGIYQGAKIFQKKAATFTDGAHRAIIGSWVVGDQPAGMIIRDHDQLIVQDVSKVVPHWFS